MARSKTYEMMVKLAGRVDGSLKAACAEAAKNLDTIGAAAQTAGKVVAGAAVAAATAVGTMGVAAVKAAGEYETQLANISTLLTGTEAEVAARTQEIGEQVLAISNRTGVATDNLTDGMYQVVSAFGDSADAASQLEIAAKSAAAGNATTTDAINLLSAVTKGYGDTSAEAVQKAADLSFATVRLGQTSFPELAASMGKVIPLAGTLGLEQEQLFGAMATLTGVTGSTAEVVTQLKATMQGFLSPSKNMTAALQSMGYESGQALLESKGLQGALDALKVSVGGDELAFAGLFSSVEAQTAVLAMAGTQSENLTQKTAEMYQAAGAAETAFQRQTDTMQYTIQTIKNMGANFLTEIGTNILPYVSDLAEAALPKVQSALETVSGYVVDTIIPAAEKAVKWVMENKTAILAVAGAVVTAVGAFKGLQVATAAIGAVKNLSTIFRAAAGSGNLLSRVLGMGNVKLALIAGVIALAAAGFVLLWKKSEKFRETVMVMWRQLQILGGAITGLAKSVWEFAAPLLEKLGGTLLNGLERAVELLAPVAGNILGIFTGIVDFITGVFSGDWDKAWQGIRSIVWNVIAGIGNLVIAGIKGMLKIGPVILSGILEIGTAIWTRLDSLVSGCIAAITKHIPVIGTTLGAVLGSLWATVQSVWGNIQVILQNVIQFVQNVFSGNWSAAWQNIVNIFGGIFSTVATIAMTPMNMLASGIQAAINAVGIFLQEKMPFLGAIFTGWGATISAAIENVKAIFSNIIEFINNVFAGNWSAAWENITNIFGNLFGAIVNLAKAPINGVISAINFVLEKINGISFTIPDWVPGLGGQSFGFSLPTIPQLATGGVVTAPTILEAGEGGEPEAVLPLSKLDAMLKAGQQSAVRQMPEQAMEITVLLPGLTEAIAAWKNAQVPDIQAPPAAVNVTTPEPPPVTMPEYPAPPAAIQAPPAAVSVTTPEPPAVTIPEYPAPPAAIQAPPAAVSVTTSEPPAVTIPEYPAPSAAPSGGALEAGLPLTKLGDLLENLDRNRIEIPDPEGGNDTPFTQLVAAIERMIQENAGTARDKPGTWTNNQGPPSDGGAKEPPPAGPAQPESGGTTTIMYSPVFNFNGTAPTKEDAEETGRLSFAEFKRLHDKLEAEDRRKNLKTR